MLFDVPVSVSVERLAGAREPDKFERESQDFFEKIRTSYLERASEYPARFQIIDANRPLAEVESSVKEVILSI